MSKLKTSISLLATPGKMIFPLARFGVFNWMPDKLYLKFVYRGHMGKKLNLEKPKSYNEKLQWLKLHDRKPLYQTLVDKAEVKKYVADKIGKQYIIPTLGVWDDANNIPFDELPDQFVIKCTHDSGSTIICQNKSKLDKASVKSKLNAHLRKNTYWVGREWPYKQLKSRIIAEQLLGNGSESINDYKVLCFDGEPKLIEVHIGRSSSAHTQDFYTTNWVRTEIEQTCEPMAAEPIQAPPVLDKMLELSRVLSEGFIHIRVDWYVIEDKLYFGELTFYDGSGFCEFKDEKWDDLLGSWIKLSNGKI